MRLIQSITLSVFTGFLLALSWPEIGNQAWVVFGAFIPLFIVVFKTRNWRSTFLYSFLSFFIWHIFTVWWMWHSTPIGSLSAWVINSMLMAIVVSFAKYTNHKLKFIPFEIILSFYWLSFEIFHLYWDFKWPWMNLGHAFANHTQWIQWYEFSGAYGGVFWVILVNGFLFRIISGLNFPFVKTRNNKTKPELIRTSINLKSRIYLLLASFLIIASPILWSQYLIKQSLLNSDTLQITLVQPNVDTYSEKFNSMSPLQQSEHVIEMLMGTPSNSLIVLPETAIPKYFNLNQEKPASIDTLLSFSRLNRVRIIGGFSTKDSSNSYNSACFIEDGIIVDSRNKIKLLAYAEKIPFDFISEYWSRMVHEQGGIAKSYGVDQEAKVFSINRDVKLGTLICFESVFSDISAEMCRKGAQALIVITNDDWWENSPGHRQHFAYARIKAIENRKYIARAANTGISGVIDPYGKIVRSSRYKESVVMQSKINLNSRLTFFSVNERNIRYSIVFLAVFLALASWWKRLH